MRGALNRHEHEIIHVEMFVIDGIDSNNRGEDTIVDLTAYSDMTLDDVHQTLLRILDVDESIKPHMQYFSANMDDTLNLSMTLEALGVQEGDRIVVDASRKKRKFKSTDLLVDTEDSEEDLTVVCYTRIFEADGIPMKKLKVQVKASQTCGNLIEDICRIWNRDNLKFRYGRHVLTSEKTFEDVGMHDFGEVLVTGARG